MIDLRFSFTATCWLWRAEKATWYFVTLPEKNAEEIKYFNENISAKKRGWRAVKVTAHIGSTTWETSIFPQKDDSYILPIKAAIRRAEHVFEGDDVTVDLTIVI